MIGIGETCYQDKNKEAKDEEKIKQEQTKEKKRQKKIIIKKSKEKQPSAGFVRLSDTVCYLQRRDSFAKFIVDINWDLFRIIC